MHDELHIVPNRGGDWNVMPAGARRPLSQHPTPRDAIRRARRVLREDGGEVLVHGRDGEIHARVTYHHQSTR